MSRIDESLATDRRRFLRAALSGGALLAVGGSFALPRLLAAGAAGGVPALVHTPPGDVLLECYADDGREAGLFRCIACATALYDAATEFDSGTGWPSFWRPIAKRNVIESRDAQFGMERIAISCAGCNSHLGHVFDDGPPPTGLRYCMNSVALRFVALKAG